MAEPLKLAIDNSHAAQVMRTRPCAGWLPVLHDTNEVRAAEVLDEIWWQGRQWAVTSHGIERRNGDCHKIAAARLHEHVLTKGGSLYWSRVVHLALYEWCDAEDLCTAYLVALALHPRPKKGALSAKRAKEVCFSALGRRRELERPAHV